MPPTKRRGQSRTTKGKGKLSLVEQSAPDSVETQQKQDKIEAGKANLARGRAKTQARARERKAARDAGVKTRLEKFRAGEYPISEWDDEEVEHGRPKDLTGGFSGAHPKFSSKDAAAIRRELLKRGERMIDTYYFDALKVLHGVALHGENESARVKAANILMERTAGKTVDKIEIKSSDPWQDILDEVMDDDVLNRVVQEQDSDA